MTRRPRELARCGAARESRRRVRSSELVSVVRAQIAARNLRGLWHSALPATSDRLYNLWTRETEPSRKALAAQRQWSLSRTRCFSLITLVTQPASWSYQRTASAVRAQTYPGWEWILVSTEDSIEQLTRAVTRLAVDDRVRVLSVPSGASRADAWNVALRAARGEYAALLGEHDVLAPAALYQMAEAFERFPEGDLFYTDEDRISPGDFRRHEPRFKPDWSPELLLSSNYIGRLAMIRVSAALSVGGFRDACGSAEEWDLFLRLSRETNHIRRVPHCLYHREETRLAPSGPDDAEPVLQNHFQRLGLEAAVTSTRSLARVSWDIQGQPTVSIIIPNRNAAAVLKQCVTGLLEGTGYPRRELVIVDNASTESEVLELYRSIERGGHGRIVAFRPSLQLFGRLQRRRSRGARGAAPFSEQRYRGDSRRLARGADTLGSAAGRRHRRSTALVSGPNDSARRRRIRARTRRPHLRQSARRRVRCVRVQRFVPELSGRYRRLPDDAQGCVPAAGRVRRALPPFFQRCGHVYGGLEGRLSRRLHAIRSTRPSRIVHEEAGGLGGRHGAAGALSSVDRLRRGSVLSSGARPEVSHPDAASAI